MARSLYQRPTFYQRSGVENWRTRPGPLGFGVGSTQIGLNEHAIDFYVEFTEGTAQVTRVQCKVRRTTTELEAHDQYDPTIGRWPVGAYAIHGSVIGLNPSETWDVYWLLSFDDGSVASLYWPGLQTKAALVLTDTATLTPTRYLTATGSDAADGLTAGTAYGTWDYALAHTPSGGILRVGDGYYASSASTAPVGALSSGITVYGENKWIGDGGVPLNNGYRVLVEPAARTSPTGSGHPNPGVWAPIAVTGPGRYGNPVRSYDLWKWTAANVVYTTEMTGIYRVARDDEPLRLAHHVKDADYLSTPGTWAEYLYTNLYYHYGFWTDGADIYCRLPRDVESVDPFDPGRDPNTCYLAFSNSTHVGFYPKSGAGSRISQIGFAGFGKAVYSVTGNTIMDHCYVGPNNQYARWENNDQYMVHCWLKDSHLAQETPDHALIPWHQIKGGTVLADGTSYGTTRVCGAAEADIFLSTSRRLTFAHNLCEGIFNGPGSFGGTTSESTRLWAWGSTFYDNTMRYVADDCFEPEMGALSWKIWSNRIEKSIDLLSTGPVHGGPIYLWFNEVWQNGGAYVGQGSAPGVWGPDGKVVFKFSSESEPQAVIYAVHNTAFSNILSPSGSSPYIAGDSAGGTTSLGTKVHERMHWYGNLFIGLSRILDEINETRTDEWLDQYNFYFTYWTSGGLKVGGISYDNTTSTTKMANYRTAKKQGLTSNLVGATTYEVNGATSQAFFEAQLPNRATGVLTLATSSPLKNLVPPCPVTFRLGDALLNVGATP